MRIPFIGLIAASLWIIATSTISPSHPSILNKVYDVLDSQTKFFIRQVPGHGSCLYNAVAAWLSHATFQRHLSFFEWKMLELSSLLRALSVQILQSDQALVMEDDFANASFLTEIIAISRGRTASEYCEWVSQPNTWAGGPELAALSAFLCCPIHIYGLATTGSFLKKRFVLQPLVKIGSPIFDHKAPIEILSADGRFPHIWPGWQRKQGDHFLALFRTEPCDQPVCSLRDYEVFDELFAEDDEHKKSKHSWIETNVAKLPWPRVNNR